MAASKGKVLLAMSGGVDSSVAAALLRDDGYEVVGCFMRLGSPGEQLAEGPGVCDPAAACPSKPLHIGKQGCCSINDARDAQRVAARLDIPLYVLNFKRDFGRIVAYFVSDYHAGRTPNPCVRCNDWLKFGKLAEYARSIDADFIASGHYARVERIDGRPALLRGADQAKDQSYVLFGAPRDRLEHMRLPVGRYRKQEIRRIAGELGLPVHDKPDSQEICFVPSNNYMDVVGKTGSGSVRPGRILDTSGKDLGEHPGHQHFTIGQRRGLGVALGYPIYVVNKDANNNTVTIGSRRDLRCASLVADQVNWLVDPPADAPLRCAAQVRYNGAAVPAQLTCEEDDRIRVQFDKPVEAVAAGQAVVCYEGDRVLCGGWIDRTHST